MIRNQNLFPNITRVTSSEIAKLENPIESLSGVRHSIVFIYPEISTDTIGGEEEVKLLRRFFAASILKEIDLTLLISNIEDLITTSEFLQKKKKSSLENRYSNPERAISSYLSYQMTKSELNSLKQNSDSIYSKFKQIIETDPYYQQYQATVAYKDYNTVKIPLVIGTKHFQVNDYALAYVVLLSIITGIPLNSLSNIKKLERIYKSKTLQQLINEFQQKDKPKLIAKLDQVLSKVRTKLGKLIIKATLLFNKTIEEDDFFMKHFYSKFTKSDIDQVFTIFKIITNIHYYNSQLNDRFSEYIVRVYKDAAIKSFNENFKKFIKQISQSIRISSDLVTTTYKDEIETITSEIDLDNLKLFYILDEDIDVYNKVVNDLVDYVDELEKAAEQLKCDTTISINGILRYFDLAAKQAAYYIQKKQQKIQQAKENIANAFDEDFITYISSLFAVAKESLSFNAVKLPKDSIRKVLEYSDYINDQIFETLEISDKQLKGILKRLNLDVFAKSDALFNVIYKDTTTILEILKPLIMTIHDMLQEKVKNVIYQYISNLPSDVQEDVIRIVDASIQETIRGVIGYIIITSICLYLKSFLQFLNIQQITFDESKLGKLQFPNYLLILPEELVSFITSIGIIVNKNIILDIPIDELEPKKILNPLKSSNTKYNTEFLVRTCKVPSIMVLTKNRSSVIYKLPFMRKVEKTSMEQIKKFVELYSVLVK